MGARETALNVLIACRKQAAWSNGVLKEYIRRDKLDRREAALATRLCYGVLQNRGELDFYLQQLLTGKIKNLHPAIHDILHLGLYQIYHMDKIPASAAVNESVQLAKKYCPKIRSASGLVNAVLRNGVRTYGALKAPVKLSHRYSHPQELIDTLKAYVGYDRLEAMLQANNAIPDLVVQVNTLRITVDSLVDRLNGEGITAKSHPWMSDCLVLSGVGDIEQSKCFQDGLFYVQDAAAKLSVLCAQIPENAKVLDACAAPGGKSFAAAIQMKNAGSIHSCDVHPHKLELISSGAKRLGFDTIQVHLQDATKTREEWLGQMDVVIADVPCSGYGIIRKKPDIRYKNIQMMKALPKLQLEILEKQACYLKTGGVLLYSTCTLVQEENEGVVEAFLEKHPEFSTEPLPLPKVFPQYTSGMFALIPGEYDTDGFFICRLRRNL